MFRPSYFICCVEATKCKNFLKKLRDESTRRVDWFNRNVNCFLSFKKSVRFLIVNDALQHEITPKPLFHVPRHSVQQHWHELNVWLVASGYGQLMALCLWEWDYPDGIFTMAPCDWWRRSSVANRANISRVKRNFWPLRHFWPSQGFRPTCHAKSLTSANFLTYYCMSVIFLLIVKEWILNSLAYVAQIKTFV